MQHWHTRHCANAPAGPAAAGSGATAGAARAGRAPGRDLSAHAPATRARRGNRPPLQAAWALQQQQAIGPGAPREAQRRARGPHPDTPRPSQPPPASPPARPGHAGARDSSYQPSGDAQTPEQTLLPKRSTISKSVYNDSSHGMLREADTRDSSDIVCRLAHTRTHSDGATTRSQPAMPSV